MSMDAIHLTIGIYTRIYTNVGAVELLKYQSSNTFWLPYLQDCLKDYYTILSQTKAFSVFSRILKYLF
jgi:hypothetical protein